jgi:hypothetical protein
MRLLLTLLSAIATVHAAIPEDLAAALKSFRADPPPGWSYTLTTAGEGKSTVERCEAGKPEFERWSLLQKDGRAPTADEARDYAEGRTRRSRGGTAPKIIEQLDLATLVAKSENGDRITYQCGVKPGDPADNVAAFLRATVVLHRPTRTIEAIELGSTGEFSPTFVVKIAEMKTQMSYALPTNDRPSLPLKVETRVRGRAFLFKSLDGEVVMTFSDYAWAGKK